MEILFFIYKIIFNDDQNRIKFTKNFLKKLNLFIFKD